jgi:hypothetical protein
LSPLQAVQYGLLRKWFDEGAIGWAEFLLLSAGGASSVPPSPDTSYATPIVFHLVRTTIRYRFSLYYLTYRLQHPFTRGSVVRLLLVSILTMITYMIYKAHQLS